MCNPTQCRYLAQASDFVATCEFNGRLRGVGPAGAAALGYKPADLVGKPLAGLVAARHRPHLGRVLHRCETGQTVWDEMTVHAADDRRVPMLCSFQRLIATGARQGLLVTGIRTESVEAGARTRVSAALGQLAFRCHSPAHRLMQAIEAVLMQYPWSEAIELCRQELDGLLDAVSQSVTGPPQVRSGHAVDVVRVMESTLRLVDGEPELKGLKVGLRPERASAWAMAHPVGLVFLALHLVRNARNATFAVKSPRLFIDVYQKGGHVVLEFADNGTGLPREDPGAAFSPFFKTTTYGHAQTGLGLVTCSELLHHMGGTLRILGRPSKGNTVVVTLPAATAPR
jgi:signal transduction histidine kinase